MTRMMIKNNGFYSKKESLAKFARLLF